MNQQGQALTQTQQPQVSASVATGRTAAAPPQSRIKVRARRGQATDPHSIAERVCFFFLNYYSICFSVALTRISYRERCGNYFIF